MFLKIQTWFPYNIQIYLNGREYLSRLLSKEDIHYAMYNNSFSYIEDFSRAQGLADGILNKKLSASFDGMAEKINCLPPDIMETVQDGKIAKSMEWVPIGKGIANLYRYAEISKAIIKRYLSAMPDIPMGLSRRSPAKTGIT